MATLYDKLKSANQQLDTAEGIFQDIGLAMVETEMIEEPVLATELADNIRENGGTGDYQKLKNKPTIDGEVLSGEVSAMITALIPDDCVKQPTADQYGDTLTNIGKSGTANVGVGAFKDSLEAWHPFVRLGSDAKSNITIETGSDGKNRLVIGDGGASQYVNQVPLKKDLPTKTSQLTNDSGFITETSPGHFIKWFAPDSEHPDVWYINFGSSSSGGISFVSDSENPTQSYIDVAGNKITAPGYVDPNAPRLMALDDDEEPEDNHLRFNSAPLAFVEEMPENTSDLTNDSGYITEAALSAIPTKTSQLENDSGFITSADMPSQEIKPEAGYLYYVAQDKIGTVYNKATFYDADGHSISESMLGSFSKVKVPTATKKITFTKNIDFFLSINGGGGGSGQDRSEIEFAFVIDWTSSVLYVIAHVTADSQEIKSEEGYLYYVASGLTTRNIRNTVKFYDSGDISEYGELLGEEKLGRFNKIKIPAGTKQVKFEQAVDITVKEGNNAYITYKDITRKVVSSSGDWTVLHLEVADVVESGGSDYVIKTVTPTESGSKLTCSVDNYAVNVIDLSSDTPLDINLPSYSGDEIRDFVIRLNVTSTTVPTVAFIPPTGESILFESDDTSWAEIETGANIISFSETQRG